MRRLLALALVLVPRFVGMLACAALAFVPLRPAEAAEAEPTSLWQALVRSRA